MQSNQTEENTFTVSGKGGKRIFVRSFDRLPYPKAGVLVLHGMGEHSGRYAEFASFLNQNGFAVYAPDHRGHGLSVDSESELGINGLDGFYRSVEDQHFVIAEILRRDPQLPLFLFGHSYGSFLAQEYITRYPDELIGVILCGSGKMDSPALRFGLILSKIFLRLFGESRPSKLLTRLCYAGYQRKIVRRSGRYDWLSRDPDVVQAYESDPLCGPIFSTGFFYYFFRGLSELYRARKLSRIPKDLPVCLISGDADPVSGYGKKTLRLKDLYESLGLSDVTCNIFPDARHELLNECNRYEVFSNVLNWMERRL